MREKKRAKEKEEGHQTKKDQTLQMKTKRRRVTKPTKRKYEENKGKQKSKRKKYISTAMMKISSKICEAKPQMI